MGRAIVLALGTGVLVWAPLEAAELLEDFETFKPGSAPEGKTYEWQPLVPETTGEGKLRSAVVIEANPLEDANNASARVLQLVEMSDDEETGSSFTIPLEGVTRVKIEFDFYLGTPARNGTLLCDVLSEQGKSLASFQILSGGVVQTNVFPPPSLVDRRITHEAGLPERVWLRAALEVDLSKGGWSLRFVDGEETVFELEEIAFSRSLEANDRVGRVVFHSGFRSARKTSLSLDNIRMVR